MSDRCQYRENQDESNTQLVYVGLAFCDIVCEEETSFIYHSWLGYTRNKSHSIVKVLVGLVTNVRLW